MTLRDQQKRLALLILSLAVASCSERPLTQLVVVVDSNLFVPAQLDAVQIEITPPTGLAVRRTAMLSGDGATALPVTLGIVHRGGPLGPVAIAVEGRHGSTVVVTRLAEVELVSGRTLVVELALEASCASVRCPARQTCAHGTCRDVVIRRDELGEFDGGIPRLGDGGLGCSSIPELCNGFDDDCDSRIDEMVDTSADPDNCGICGNPCAAHPHARPACSAGLCGLSCETGYGDCNGDARDGCEEALNTLSMCGACAMGCSVAHGAPTCFLGTCDVDSCAPGWGDCNGLTADGCEAPLNDPASCGTCAPCALAGATASCSGGVCGIAMCDAPFGDCNHTPSDGCEVRLDTLANCGACSRSCPPVANATSLCTAGLCEVACTTGYADCDSSTTTGCEASLRSMSDCGACGVTCALAHASETCAPTGCQLGACDPGWGDCNTTASDGCETPLDTMTDCGACGGACSGATPLCGTLGAVRSCVSACAVSMTLCSGTCADLTTSLSHCGGCGRACAPAHAVGACAASSCAIVSCDPGFGDCNASVSDGCETRLDTLASCGGCGVVCDLAGAGEVCDSGRCVITTCDPGLGDCDGTTANGCETSLLSLTSCGACGVPCTVPGGVGSCATGMCEVVSCAPGRADCNGLPADGCEVTLGVLTDCRACGDVCDVPRATESCATGACALAVCDLDWADCNSNVVDGCERSLTTATDCGGCGVPCAAAANGTTSCATGACVLSCAAGYGDCNGLFSDGCEQPLNDATHCGGCTTSCSGGTPLCTDLGAGAYGCRSGCAMGETLCASACSDLLTDEMNCGMCTELCAPAAATGVCIGGACRISRCTAGFGDCNMSVTDGCERSTRTLTDCGGCGTACGPFMNATASCTTGTCALMCSAGFGDCDAMPATGCERALTTVTNCGVCGRVCATVAHSTPSCTAGACALTCSGRWRDCNTIYSDGCEVNTGNSRTNCGMCGHVCAAGLSCNSGVCG